jgi:hypothetical protein
MLILTFYDCILMNYLIVLEVYYQNNEINNSLATSMWSYVQQNQYLIVMCGMYTGNYFSRSFLYDYLLSHGLSLTLI